MMWNYNKISAPIEYFRINVDGISNVMAITLTNPLYAPSIDGTVDYSIKNWGKNLSNGSLSDNFLFPVIHELTHQNSLQGPVGASLSALSISHTSYIGQYDDAEKIRGTARDIIRSSIYSSFLRPMLEGTALFAEFDAIPGDTSVSSWSSMVSARLFCFENTRKAYFEGKDMLFVISEKLKKLRQSAAAVERKMQLLSQEIRDPGGYLLGYLLVKYIWSELVSKHSIWKDSDMFVMFINDYFFSDYHLAHRIIDKNETSIEKEINEVQIYLHNRLIELIKFNEKYADEFLKYYSKLDANRPSYQQFDSIDHSLHHFYLRERTLRSLHIDTPDFFAARNIPRLLAVAAKVSISKKGEFEVFFIDGTPTMKGPALENARSPYNSKREGTGSVEAILFLPGLGPEDLKIVLCVFMDKDLVAVYDPENGEFNNAKYAEPLDNTASFLAYESFAMQVEAERLLPKGSKAEVLLQQYSGKNASNKTVELWAPFALCPVRRDYDMDTLKKIEQGLGNALAIDSEALKSLCSFSLTPLEQIVNLDKKLEVEKLNVKSMETMGYNLFNIHNGKFGASRV